MIEKKRLVYIDLMNILATFGVIVLHSSEAVFQFQFSLKWIVAATLQVLFIWAVPVFLMLSGAGLLDYRERYTTKLFFLKRIFRVGIPFVLWSIIWYVWDIFIAHKSFSIQELLKGFWFNTNQNIFWFFYIIIAFYILTPIISRITQVQYRESVEYLIIVSVILIGVFSYIVQIFNKPLPYGSVYFAIVGTPFLLYFILGWYLKHFTLKVKLQRFLLIFAFVLNVVEIIMTIYFSIRNNQPSTNIYAATGLPTIATVVSIWLMAKKISVKINNKQIKIGLQKLASCSFGVYLIHEFFIYLAENKLGLEPASWSHLLLLPLGTYLLSVLVVYLVKQVRILQYIFP